MIRPLFAMLVMAATAAHTAPSSDAFPFPIRVDRLPSGLTVARVAFPSPGLVAYYTVMRVGARNEVETGHTGFAHFFEHTMFKGTPRFPPGEREKRIVARYGLDDNAATSDDYTVYETFGPNEALPALIDAEADRFQYLTYTESSFQTEARAVLGEYNKDVASPETLLEERLVATAFTRHTYRHTALGFREDILRMPQQFQYSLGFFHRFYRPDNAVILVVGDFDDASVMAKVRASYAGWTGAGEKPAVPTEPVQNHPRTANIDWPGPTLPRLWLAWHTPAVSLQTSDEAVSTVLASYLAGATSPLYQSLVLEKQWVESIVADNSPHRDPHLFGIYSTVKDPAHVGDVEAAVSAAIAEVAAGRIDGKRLGDIKSAIHYGKLMNLETVRQVMDLLVPAAAFYGDPRGVNHELEALSRVTPAQLTSFAKAHLTMKNRTRLTLTGKTRVAEESPR